MPLTFRETQITALVMRAMLNKEIAFVLKLSEGTVKEYLNRIFKKTGCRNRTELAMQGHARHIEMPAVAA